MARRTRALSKNASRHAGAWLAVAAAVIGADTVVTDARAAEFAALPPDPPLTDAHYWSFADRVAAGVEPLWSEGRDAYVRHDGSPSIRVNSNMLVAHAVAALDGHQGPARQDSRARSLVARMTQRPVWYGPARAAVISHPAACWATDLAGRRPGHLSLESKVAEALAWAWRAREELGLRRSATERIEEAVNGCAWHRRWRYPSLMANQINWNAEIYASAAAVTGRGSLLRRDYRRHLGRFATGITRPMPKMRSSNLGPGYSFRYSPRSRPGIRVNLDSPEYANIVVHAIQHYGLARRRGARGLPARKMRLMRAWVTRLLAGAWTHAGYLNWDTGHGRGRWHSGQYWVFAQQGLQAIAVAPQFWARPEYGRWAKALFDRGLILYARLADEAGQAIAPVRPFGVRAGHEEQESFSTRVLANAARAIAMGLGSMPAEDPPPLYSYDYDSGRVAVSTPRYSTAIIPVNHGAFPYGGIDPARLFGAGQRVAANVGGTPPNAFGIVVSDSAGREVLASQRPRRHGRPPLRIVSSPVGRIRRPRAYPARPYAGPFSEIQAVGARAARGVRVEASHRFLPESIESGWRVTCARGCASRRVRAHFPTWGDDAVIDVVRRDGSRVRLGGPGADPDARVRLAEAERIELGRGERGGYTLVPQGGPDGAVLTATAARPQRTNPDPGPRLDIELVAFESFSETGLRVEIRPET
jgi:hypothetical protein